ncbi:gamma-glutamylcyclotransferase [uncultured Devosia sp.]|uniref:gamma-glutamylcyclotransferase n=1 Tax=uncultured Devosia sp. TaxID=211434 RepID=UPI0035CC4B9F
MALPEMTSPAPTHWVFGYGSLMWNPGFAHVSSQLALLHGAHRGLSVYSHDHRGTPQQPGLVFGLSRGGACRGMAFEVLDADWAGVRAYLLVREKGNGIYREALRPVRLDDGRVVDALSFVVDERHAQYARDLSLEQQVLIVRSATGESGSNVDYVLQTARRLRQLGIRDRQIMALAALLEGAASSA